MNKQSLIIISYPQRQFLTHVRCLSWSDPPVRYQRPSKRHIMAQRSPLPPPARQHGIATLRVGRRRVARVRRGLLCHEKG